MTGPARVGVSRSTVAVLHLPGTLDSEITTVTHQPPWASAVEVFPGIGLEPAVTVLATRARPDATVLVGSRSTPPAAETLRAATEVRRVLPAAEVLSFESESVLRFLWCYRDGHDPLALARASDRLLFDECYFRRSIPAIRSGKRSERRRAVEEVRGLLRRTGSSMGVALPFPQGEREESTWGLSRICGLIEAGLGLYAGLLRRWCSPLAVVRERAGAPPHLDLMDRYLRNSREIWGLIQPGTTSTPAEQGYLAFARNSTPDHMNLDR